MSLPTTNTGYPSVQQHQPEAEPSLTTMQLGLGSPSPQAIGVPVSPSPSSPATATPHAATTPILPTAASPALSPSPARWRGPPNPHDAEQLREHQERELRYGLQARGQNYNVSGKAVWGRGRSKAWEWEERQRRDEAASILDSEEMIMWFSAARNEVCLSLSSSLFFTFRLFLTRKTTEYHPNARPLSECTPWS
jgi:hypothetical protein